MMSRALAAIALLPCLAMAQDDEDEALAALNLQALMGMEVEVTSVSKRAQPLSETAAAIFVLTAEDIRRSTATTIPDLLRLVPGLHVANINSSTWSVSSRGFSGQFANKLLVLIDGRSVYTPLFSGVFWDEQDLLLEDIERIEVIRGPGAALWGANAVNGVINIITKHAKDTQGGQASVLVGNEDQAITTLRYGAASEQGHWRVWAKTTERDDSHGINGADPNDAWKSNRAGFRGDWTLENGDELTVTADLYNRTSDFNAALASLTTPPVALVPWDGRVSGGSVLGRWTRQMSSGSEASLQLFYDNTSRESVVYSEDHATYDLEFQHRLPLGERHDLIWGLGLRQNHSTLRGSAFATTGMVHHTDNVLNLFAQDEIAITPGEFSVILGTKLERNRHTGYELQPNARAIWTLAPDKTLWASVSRAVRTPSVVSHTVTINQLVLQGPGPVNTLVQLQGNDDFESEELLAWELGYRTQPAEDISVDIAAFFNEYDNLLTLEPGAPSAVGPTSFILPVLFDNQMHGTTRGVEVLTRWQVQPDWSLSASYSLLSMDLRAEATSKASTPDSDEDASPRHQMYVRSLYDINDRTQFDATIAYVDDISGLGVGSYTSADARVGWRLNESTELSLGLRNVFHDEQQEYVGVLFGGTTEVQTQVYLKATIRF